MIIITCIRYPTAGHRTSTSMHAGSNEKPGRGIVSVLQKTVFGAFLLLFGFVICFFCYRIAQGRPTPHHAHPAHPAHPAHHQYRNTHKDVPLSRPQMIIPAAKVGQTISLPEPPAESLRAEPATQHHRMSRAAAAPVKNPEPSYEWQLFTDDSTFPPGLEFREDFETDKKEVRIPPTWRIQINVGRKYHLFRTDIESSTTVYDCCVQLLLLLLRSFWLLPFTLINFSWWFPPFISTLAR
jgi:hypothetical protein